MIIKKIVLLLFFIIMFAPMWFMLTGSFQDTYGVTKMPPDLLPRNPTMKNYEVIAKWNILTWLSNTGIVVISGTIISVLVSSMAGYVFAFYNFRFKKYIWALMLIGIFLPRISILIPTYVILSKLKISGSLFGAILPFGFSPFAMYLSRIYFQSVPISLLESARLDGANELQILLKIVGPVSAPIIAALATFSAIGLLQDYIWQALVLQKTERQTLIVGLIRSLMERGGGELNVSPIGKSLAVGVILITPLIVIFLFTSKYFVSTLGGVEK